MRVRRRSGALVVAAVLGVAGCAAGEEDGASSSTAPSFAERKEGSGEVRRDLEPLTTRWAALGEPRSATWMSGTLGGRAPGPSTYWIDAVVELEPRAADELRALDPVPTADRPAVTDEVATAIPGGRLRRGADLDAAFAQGSWGARAYLVEGSDTVVLVALGE